MTFYDRALRYIGRKRAKSILLLACFLIISTMVLCATMILETAQTTKNSIQEKTGAKLVLASNQGTNTISDETIATIEQFSSITKVNRVASNIAYPTNFSPVIMKDGTETLNLAVTLHAYDNTEIDGYFAQEKYRLIAGTTIHEEQHGILVNSILAEHNQLEIGDKLVFETENGKTASGEVIGIFFSGMERKQEDTIVSAYRIENQIFVDFDLFADLYGKSGFSSVSFYTANPDNLNELYQQVKLSLDDTISLTTSDTLYQQMQAPLKQVIRTTSLMLILIIMTATIVISLLLCMWTRTRAKEMAVFISMGVSKGNLLLQAMTESLTLFLLSVFGATGITALFAEQLVNKLFSTGDFANLSNTHLELPHIVTLLLLGSGIVLISVGISAFPILRANPRETLSRMEG